MGAWYYTDSFEIKIHPRSDSEGLVARSFDQLKNIRQVLGGRWHFAMFSGRTGYVAWFTILPMSLKKCRPPKVNPQNDRPWQVHKRWPSFICGSLGWTMVCYGYVRNRWSHANKTLPFTFISPFNLAIYVGKPLKLSNFGYRGRLGNYKIFDLCSLGKLEVLFGQWPMLNHKMKPICLCELLLACQILSSLLIF